MFSWKGTVQISFKIPPLIFFCTPKEGHWHCHVLGVSVG